MPNPYPAEFRADVVREARKRETTLGQIAKDFGISEATLHNWLKRADVEDGVRPGVTDAQASDLRDLKKRNRLLEQEDEIDLAPGGRLLRSGAAPKMTYPLVLDLADDGIPVTVTCRVLGFSTQAFNKWRRNPISQRDWDEAHLINAALDIHDDDPMFGYRFIADELAQAGFSVSERRVWRLCSQEGIWSVFAKKKGLSKKAGPPVHDDLVDRDFHAERSNTLWLTDITEHWTYFVLMNDEVGNPRIRHVIREVVKK